jgi:hypothetical protein
MNACHVKPLHCLLLSAWLAAPTGTAWSQTPPVKAPEGLWVKPLGRPTQIEGSWDASYERRNNFDLQSARSRDRRDTEHEVKLRATTDWSETVQTRFEGVGLHETSVRQGSDTRRNVTLGRGETWVRWSDPKHSPLSWQAGRISLSERRAWWWDEDLDSVRVRWNDQAWGLDMGLARELARVYGNQSGIDPAQKGVLRWFGQGSWRWTQDQQLDGFWLVSRDSSGVQTGTLQDEDAADPSDLRARWLGLRASGEFRYAGDYRLNYWADTAWFSGTERLTSFDEDDDGRLTADDTVRRRLRGHAFDLGATLALPMAMKPRLSVGLARGSGGTRSDAVDNNFRQTGLQENRSRLGGLKRMYRYGQLLRPDLSNLSVATLGAGVRLTDDASVELAWHRYRQVRASEQLTGARLTADPSGASRDIGQEIDLLLTWRSSKQVEFTLGLSRFRPGKAFKEGERDSASGVELGLTLGF